MKRCEALSLALLTTLPAFLAGCPSAEIAHPVLVDRNTFGFAPPWWDKNVTLVCVQTADWSGTSQKPGPPAWIGPCTPSGRSDIKDAPPFTTLWAVRATMPVSARDFRLVPGQVPPGFEQIIPAGSETFAPAAGQTYYILVCLEPVGARFLSVAATWRPDQTPDALPPQGLLQVEGPFRHEASGMVFPTEIGWFKRTDVHRYDLEALDVGVGYLLPSRRDAMIATVYVYPIPTDHVVRSADGRLDPGRSLRAHYEETIREIRKAHAPAQITVVSQEDTSHSHQGREYAGRAAVFEFEGPWAGSTERLRSYLYLFGPIAERWMIKYRFTHPQRANGPEDVQEFLRQYTWTLNDL